MPTAITIAIAIAMAVTSTIVTRPVIVATPVTSAIVIKIIIAAMIITPAIVPMVTILFVTAVAYYFLTTATSITCILCSVYIITLPWVTLAIYNNLIAIIDVVISVSYR